MEYITLDHGVKMPQEGYGVFQIPSEGGRWKKYIGKGLSVPSGSAILTKPVWWICA